MQFLYCHTVHRTYIAVYTAASNYRANCHQDRCTSTWRSIYKISCSYLTMPWMSCCMHHRKCWLHSNNCILPNRITSSHLLSPWPILANYILPQELDTILQHKEDMEIVRICIEFPLFHIDCLLSYSMSTSGHN